jgi:hypothetical protein
MEPAPRIAAPRVAACLIAAAVAVLPASAGAWGVTGHAWISGLAMRALPAELPAFLRTPAAFGQVELLSSEPDRWRMSGEPHDAERDPAHYVHIDDQGLVLGAMPVAALPPTREAFDTALRAKGATQYAAGYLPYAIVDGWQQLVTDLAYWRIDRVGGRKAATAADRAWFRADMALRQQLTIRDLGVWSHYVGDASNPMHVSVHYNSWGPGPNPQGYSTDDGLHWTFEAIFVKANLARGEAGAAVPPYRDCACTIVVQTGAYLEASRAEAPRLYQLEKQGAFARPTAESRRFVAGRIGAGAAMVRDMTVAAWRASATAGVGFSQVKVSDIESGKTAPTRALLGDA